MKKIINTIANKVGINKWEYKNYELTLARDSLFTTIAGNRVEITDEIMLYNVIDYIESIEIAEKEGDLDPVSRLVKDQLDTLRRIIRLERLRLQYNQTKDEGIKRLIIKELLNG